MAANRTAEIVQHDEDCLPRSAAALAKRMEYMAPADPPMASAASLAAPKSAPTLSKDEASCVRSTRFWAPVLIVEPQSPSPAENYR